VLRHRAYRRLWLAAVVSRAGDTLNFVALPLFVYAATHSPTVVSVLVIAEIAGAVGGALLAGPFVDRLPPRRLLIAADLARLLAAASLAVIPTAPGAVVAAFVLAIATAMFSPTSNALIPRLVNDDELTTANAMQWTAGVLLQLVLAPIGGLLVAVVSARVPFALNAASFALSAVILGRLPPQRGLAVHASALLQLSGAARAFRRSSLLRALVMMQTLAALAVGATSALLVVLARQAFGLSATGYGLWLAAIGAGALAGPLLLTAARRVNPANVVTAAYAIRGGGDALLGVLGNGAAGAGILVVYGLNTSSGTVAFQTLVQQGVSADLRGRAFALLDAVWQSGRLVSIALGGVAASVFGIRPLYLAGGALLVVAAAVGALLMPRMPAAAAAHVAPPAVPSHTRE
jgi:MFS family permease